jgi:hypothetical protein
VRLRLALAVFALIRVANAQSHVGPGARGLPALGHVAVAERSTEAASIGFDLGYQLVEPLTGEQASHHAAAGTLGGAVPLSPWAVVGASLHGLYMRHPEDERGDDNSGVGYPAVHARLGSYEGPLGLGCEVTGWFPGQDAPSLDWDATSISVSALISHRAETSPWTYSVNVGYGWDNSAAAAPPIRSMRRGDRVALGASSYDSVRAGLAAGYQNERTLFFGELSGDWLYATTSPATSPVRVAFGVRHLLSKGLLVEARGQFGLSARQDFASDVYQPYEPRFAVFLGPRFTFGVPEPTQIPHPNPQPPPVVLVKASAPLTVFELSGQVADERDAPLSQVQVYAKRGAWEARVESAPDGTFRFRGVPSGDIELRAVTVDYEPRTLSVVVGGTDAVVTIPILHLEAEHLSAQVEGIVRAFDGNPLSATVLLQPGHQTLHTDTNGNFRVEVAPGTYDVAISADGYEGRTHTVTVQAEGVVIVNAELRKR